MSCAVNGCTSHSGRKETHGGTISFHRFPKEEDERRIWIASTGKRNWEPPKEARMCSKHFEENCFRKTSQEQQTSLSRKTYLKSYSIPTNFIHAIPTDYMNAKAVLDIRNHTDHDYVIIKSEMPADTMDVPTQTDMPACDYVIIKSEIPVETMDVETQTETPAPHQYAKEKSLGPIVTPKVGLLMLQVNKLKRVSEDRHKKIAALRHKNWRLEKKNAKLLATIQDLRKRS